MKYSLKKIQQQLGYLEQQIHKYFRFAQNLRLAHDKSGLENHGIDLAWKAIEFNDQWSGRDDFYWLKFDIPIVKNDDGKSVIYLELGRTGDGNNSGFEGLVFVNGEELQAVDSNHREVFLEQAEFKKKVNITIKLWTGLEGGGKPANQVYYIKEVSYGPENCAIRKLYLYMKNIVELLPELHEDDPLLYSYERLVTDIFSEILWEKGISNSYAKKIIEQIDDFIHRHKNEKPNFEISAIGHTHIDVAWLWRYKHTKEKAIRSFNTAISLMKENNQFNFFFSAPQVYEFVRQSDPDLMKKVQLYINKGRWEADGATWLEPDINIPSGESLTRQFLYGMEYFYNILRVRPKVLWLPDVFGYSAALPQIMRGFGIKNFVTSKIGWNDTNRMPHDTFIWKGQDGSKVLTYFITTAEKDFDYDEHKVWKYTYNGEITSKVIMTTYREYKDKYLNNELLLPYGFGDGGGGSTREMIQSIDIMNQLPGLPKIKNQRVDVFFHKLRKRLLKNDELSTWNGELYLEFHRGTYTSQSFIKRQNRLLEFAIRNLEMLATTRMIRKKIEYPYEEIKSIWIRILKNQFHDVLPGSSIGEVYEDVRKEYQSLWDEIEFLNRKLGHDRVRNIKTGQKFILVNSNTHETIEPIFVKTEDYGEFIDNSNKVIESVRVHNGYFLRVTVSGMSSMGVKFVKKENHKILSHRKICTKNEVTTSHYVLKWNKQGIITSIFDRDNKMEVLSGMGNVLGIYEDRPIEFDAWNIDEDYINKKEILTAKNIIVNRNAGFTVITMEYYFGRSVLKQKIKLSNWSRRIDFETFADWKEHQMLLRTEFDINILSDYVTYDVQYGNLKRENIRNNSWQSAKFEVVGHKWADVSQRDYGVALLSDSKYGYSSNDKKLSISLIKSGIFPDPDADIGQHYFTYSLLPHKGDFIQGRVEPLAMELNSPTQIFKAKDEIECDQPLFEINDVDSIEVDAIKLSEDGERIILRLHDFSGGNHKVRITANFKCTSASLIRLDEKIIKDAELKNNTVVVDMTPYKVLTLAFRRSI